MQLNKNSILAGTDGVSSRHLNDELNKIGNVGSKQVDETDMADGKILEYDSVSGKMKYVDKPVGGDVTGATINDNATTSTSETWSANKLTSELDGKSSVSHTHNDLHSHSNKTTLDAIEEAYTTTEKNKLAGIEENATASDRADPNKAFVVEVRTDDPISPEPGRIWFRSDL